MKRDFTAIYKKSGKWIVAWIEEIPGVNTQGRNLKEAKENLREAIQLILEVNRNISLSKSKNYKREPISVFLPA
jgi:predicted RNase H-like HicB family nuclease